MLESLRNGTVGGTAVSINESLQSLLNDLKELEETMASRASEKLKTTLEQQASNKEFKEFVIDTCGDKFCVLFS